MNKNLKVFIVAALVLMHFKNIYAQDELSSESTADQEVEDTAEEALDTETDSAGDSDVESSDTANESSAEEELVDEDLSAESEEEKDVLDENIEDEFAETEEELLDDEFAEEDIDKENLDAKKKAEDLAKEKDISAKTTTPETPISNSKDEAPLLKNTDTAKELLKTNSQEPTLSKKTLPPKAEILPDTITNKKLETKEAIQPTEEILVAPVLEQKTDEISLNNEEPDSDLEEKIYKAYSRLAPKPLSTEDWSQIADERSQEIYNVQKGDTLWDISQTLFGSGYFWPKIWQLNEKITNPHDIKSSLSLKFTEGSLESLPGIETQESEAEDLNLAEGGQITVDEELVDEEYSSEIPEPKIRRPVLNQIPPSLGEWRPFDKQPNNQVSRVNSSQVNANFYVKNFLAESVPVSIGRVIEVEEDRSFGSLEKKAIIEISSGGVGDKLVAFEVEDPLVSNDKQKTILGYPVQVTGALTIVDVIDPAKRLYKAIVNKNLNMIKVGSDLQIGSLPKQAWNNQALELDIQANIIGGQTTDKKRYFDISNTVYLDKGSEQGMKEGALLKVIQNHSLRNPKSNQLFLNEEIASLILVKTEPNRSTAVIIKAKDAVMPGDMTGKVARAGMDVEGQ